jgi:iron(III) transport system ATP-binding protein
VDKALGQVGLKDLHSQYPGQLSGGQQQRVALARALVADAKVLLFDEPLSNVDAKVREELRGQLVEMQRELGFTAVHVTHDQDEAMELADRIAVLNSGHIEQLAPPREVYSHPATRYVAEFVGAANLYRGTVASRQGSMVEVDTSFGRIVADDAEADVVEGAEVNVMFRPEDVELGAGQGVNTWSAEVVRSSFSGSQQTVQLDLGGERLSATVDKDAVFSDESTTSMSVAAADVRVLVRESSR